LVQKLIAILDGTNSPKVKVDAVIVLGEYRAQEAVPVLLQHFEWDDAARGGIFNGITPREEITEKGGAVTMALIQIGTPAISAILKKMAEVDDIKTIRKCAFICNRIEGPEMTQFRLDGLLAKETDPKKRTRIQSALDTLEKIKRGDPVL